MYDDQQPPGEVIDATAQAEQAYAEEAQQLGQQEHASHDVDVLYKIYMEKRINAQRSFYESRIRENRVNARFTFVLGAAVMVITSLIATISAGGTTPLLSLLSAILPALAAMLTSFRQLYGWERQTGIYRDALMGMERALIITPDKDREVLADMEEIYPKLIAETETVLAAEANQWGQQTESAQIDTSEDGKLLAKVGDDPKLTNEQVAALQRIIDQHLIKQQQGGAVSVSPIPPNSLPAAQVGTAVSLSESEIVDAMLTTGEVTATGPMNAGLDDNSDLMGHEFAAIEVQPVEGMDNPLVEADADLPDSGLAMDPPAPRFAIKRPFPATEARRTADDDYPLAPDDALPAMSYAVPAEADGDVPPPETISALAPGAAHVSRPRKLAAPDVDAEPEPPAEQ
jgi:hypothetical protein